MATGDELASLGEPLRPGQIYNSNAWALAAAVEEAGGSAAVIGIVRDDPTVLRAAFESVRGFDVVVSTGGVSVGDFDFVKQIMDEMGLERRFWQVAQKPGKPITFAARERQLYFGLPGNPVSSLVCFVLYVAPALRRALGRDEVVRADRPGRDRAERAHGKRAVRAGALHAAPRRRAAARVADRHPELGRAALAVARRLPGDQPARAG